MLGRDGVNLEVGIGRQVAIQSLEDGATWSAFAYALVTVKGLTVRSRQWINLSEYLSTLRLSYPLLR